MEKSRDAAFTCLSDAVSTHYQNEEPGHVDDSLAHDGQFRHVMEVILVQSGYEFPT